VVQLVGGARQRGCGSFSRPYRTAYDARARHAATFFDLFEPERRGLSFTFAAYVLYDFARLLQWPVEGPLLSGLFLLATITALVAVWGLYREGRSK
jgi:hypothetical protein